MRPVAQCPWQKALTHSDCSCYHFLPEKGEMIPSQPLVAWFHIGLPLLAISDSPEGEKKTRRFMSPPSQQLVACFPDRQPRADVQEMPYVGKTSASYVVWAFLKPGSCKRRTVTAATAFPTLTSPFSKMASTTPKPLVGPQTKNRRCGLCTVAWCLHIP